MFSSFDLALSGLLRSYVGLVLFQLGMLVFVAVWFVGFPAFLPFHLYCAIHCHLTGLEVFQVLRTMHGSFCLIGRCLLVLVLCLYVFGTFRLDHWSGFEYILFITFLV